MYLVVIEEKDRLVNLPSSHLDVLRSLSLPFEQKSFSFCIPRDRWDKEFFKLQGSTLTSNMAGLVDGSTAGREVSRIDCLPVNVKELIAAAAGAFAKATTAPLERIKILLQMFSSVLVLYSCYLLLLHDRRLLVGCELSCTYPLDLAHTKLPYQSGITDVLTTVYKEAGIRGLYRGVGPTLIGILPDAGSKFYIYEVLKTHVPIECQKSILKHLPCGALAGLLGRTFTYPLDVVRRQMQESLHTSTIQGDTRYRNTWERLTTIVHNQGWGQLFAGLSISYIKLDSIVLSLELQS
ncbi:hypothetical protein PTKIN_Ptkin03bG0210000 [Pterospermum kingtungense]